MKLWIVVVLASILLLSVRFFCYYSGVKPYTNGQSILLRVTLNQEPEVSNQGQKFVVKNDQNQRIYITSNLNTLYHYGDKLAISGKLQVSKNQKGMVFYILHFPQISPLTASKNPLVEASLYVREKSLRLVQQTLPKISSSLMLGIVFGAKEDFPDAFFQNLKSTGVLHVIAASGMNVSFFTGAILFSLGMVFKRQISLLLSLFAVIFYSFLVGFEPSILRASVMAMIVLSASFFGRQTFALLSLFATGFVLLLWQPNYLFDVGFQLSFMATLGILVVKPVFERIGKLGWLESLREDLFTTTAAQIATLPILLGTFGTIGFLSLPVNLLVLWTVPILMLLGSLAVLFGLFFPLVGKLLLLLSLPFLFFFEQVVSLFGGLNWNLQVTALPWEIVVGYYLLIAAGVGLFRRKHEEGP